MATLANRDWYIAGIDGKPIKVRCLSQNYVLATARVVDEFGRFGEVDTRALHRTPEDILAMCLSDERDQWWCCSADYPNHDANCSNTLKGASGRLITQVTTCRVRL